LFLFALFWFLGFHSFFTEKGDLLCRRLKQLASLQLSLRWRLLARIELPARCRLGKTPHDKQLQLHPL
jgi:hypothetical protein